MAEICFGRFCRLIRYFCKMKFLYSDVSNVLKIELTAKFVKNQISDVIILNYFEKINETE